MYSVEISVANEEYSVAIGCESYAGCCETVPALKFSREPRLVRLDVCRFPNSEGGTWDAREEILFQLFLKFFRITRPFQNSWLRPWYDGYLTV